MTRRKVKYELRPGGSERGVSFYEGTLRCPLRQKLKKQMESKRVHIAGAAGTGTLGHGFLDLFHTKQIPRTFDPAQVIYTAPKGYDLFIDEKARDTADRVCRFYRARFAPEHFGKVLGAEIPLEAPADAPWLPEGLRLTGIADMAVRVNKKTSANLALSRLAHIEPGDYLIDHKFLGSAQPAKLASYLTSLQMIAYQLMWPGKPLKGMLLNIVVTSAVPVFRLLYKGPPTDLEKRMLYEQLELAQSLHDDAGSPPFVTGCYDFNKECGFMGDKCERVQQ